MVKLVFLLGAADASVSWWNVLGDMIELISRRNGGNSEGYSRTKPVAGMVILIVIHSIRVIGLDK